MATKVEFKRVQTDAEVENIDIKDGQLIYTGTGKTYMDYGTERIPTGSGSIALDTEMSDTSENAVQNKVIKEYVDSQTVPEEVIVSDTQPTGDDWKLWIDSDEVGSQASEITNEYSTSIGLGYSANYINTNIGKVISGTYNETTDNSGKVLLPIPANAKCVYVEVQHADYIALKRYINHTDDSIIYVRTISNLNTSVPNTNLDFKYSYIIND